MPLSPAPLTPGLTPLPNPGERPANRRTLLFGAVFGLVALAASLVTGQLALTRLVFIAPDLLSRASSSQGAATTATTFQGFSYVWTKRSQGPGGYTTPGSLQNLQSEARDFHMNTVVIPVVADMPKRSGSEFYWHTTDKYASLDILPDTDYIKAIEDARKAGLEPVIELQVRQQAGENTPDERPKFIGWSWYSLPSNQSLFTNNGSIEVGTLEHTWVDEYTAFAAHFAQLAQSKNVHYFIVGDGLGNLTADGSNSTAKSDPQGVAGVAGDGFDASKCSGRHECEWRHIIHAVRAATYANYIGGGSQPGGKYTGKLIYAAGWEPGDAATSSNQGEFEGIQWWDAVDAIGVDAYFPLTTDADLQVPDLMNAWRGKGVDLSGQADIFSRLQKVSDKFGKVIIFTAAGYESTQGSNSKPGRTEPGVTPDGEEQLSDMQALLKTFTGTAWWAGVFWSYDQPLVPRSTQDLWRFGTQWAGDQLHGNKETDSKQSGVWLSTYYKTEPPPCLC
jgi:hypothetical protein